VKLFSHKAAPAAQLDPNWGDPDASRVRGQLAKGKWREVHAFLDSVHDWDDRQFYVRVLTDDVGGRPAWTQEWVKAEPGSSTAWLMRGAHGVKWAWDARGSGMAEGVKDDAWKVFWQRLHEAEQDLHNAAELDPRDPVPWSYLLMSGRGLETGIPDLGERLKEVLSRRPWHHVALSQTLQGYAKKWGGSHELMFDLARQVAAGAPEGSSAHTVVAEAHIERWLYMTNWDREEAAALAYFENPAVQEEIRAAAGRSIFSAAYDGKKLAPADYNIFTYVFFRMHDWEHARKAMQLMNGILNRQPWAYAGNPEQIFTVISQRIVKGQ
jgi:hypothetical protein